MICCSCGKEIDINYGREYWNGLYCKKCAYEMLSTPLSTPEDTKKYEKIIADLQSENAELKSSLTHANEECLKWHERAQNLLKDSGGSISGYEKKISDLQAENAALRERLDRAIEGP